MIVLEEMVGKIESILFDRKQMFLVLCFYASTCLTYLNTVAIFKIQLLNCRINKSVGFGLKNNLERVVNWVQDIVRLFLEIISAIFWEIGPEYEFCEFFVLIFIIQLRHLSSVFMNHISDCKQSDFSFSIQKLLNHSSTLT